MRLGAWGSVIGDRAAVRDLDQRPVTERRSVRLKEIRGTSPGPGVYPPRSGVGMRSQSSGASRE